MTASVGDHVDTTLYGDLPEDFWGEQRADADRADHSTPVAAASVHERATEAHDSVAPRAGDLDGAPGAVPLFVPTEGGAESPRRGGAPSSGEPPSEPEGERFEQLQVLFPGRIIEVSRRVAETAGSGTAAGVPADAPASDHEGSADYSSAAGNESADEPRYDPAAEAAAEESR